VGQLGPKDPSGETLSIVRLTDTLDAGMGGGAMDDRKGQPLQVQKAIRPIGDELASCLERFLAASADDRTLDRSREALTLWYRLTERYSATVA